MTWTNYHTHCYLCDGQGELEAYVAEARQQGLYALGFSSHAPLPFENDWTLSAEGLQTYVAKINQLKMECAETLPIYLSLEIDYIPGETSPTIPRFQSIGLDYTLGAVHFAGKDDQGEYWSIDHTAEVFVAGLKAIYDNNIQAAVGTYYQIVRDMIKNHCPDVVAHLDLIKK
ncbi:MAG: PHP domain-containing protein, partial [Chloroflexota bacterium]